VNHLERIVVTTREEVARRRHERPLEDLPPAPGRRPFADALRRPGLSLIAEHKRRSPSAGAIREELPLEQVVSAYERGGAAALSVLTEGPNFGGELADLAAARAASTLPILRKDFIVDRYQVYEAGSCGADAILLIVAALTPNELAELHELAAELKLAALVEVHNEAELQAAIDVGAQLIGINNRDLTTLEVDTRRAFELHAAAPDGATVIAESGYCRRDQLDELFRAGIEGVLIGEALMRAEDIEAACRELTAPTMLT
jgi:indole-3-glycerol phosphate synthase